MNIKRLILEGEGTLVDFKKTITSSQKIAKSLVAFANCKGGQLLIGVNDAGKIVGVKSEEEEKYMITRSANQFCKPAIEPKFDEIYIDDKLVLVVSIEKSDIKPHYALDDNNKWWAYYRVKDKCILASNVILEVLKNENKETGRLIIYTDLEQKLFRVLGEEGRITLKQFSKLTRSSHKKSQKILVNLLLTGVLEAHTSEKEEFFTFKNSK